MLVCCLASGLRCVWGCWRPMWWLLCPPSFFSLFFGHSHLLNSFRCQAEDGSLCVPSLITFVPVLRTVEPPSVWGYERKRGVPGRTTMLLLRRRDDTLAGKTQGKTSSARPVCPCSSSSCWEAAAPLLVSASRVSAPPAFLAVRLAPDWLRGWWWWWGSRLMVGGAGLHRQTV